MVALPAFAARLMMGEMADELLLASARVEPASCSDRASSSSSPSWSRPCVTCWNHRFGRRDRDSRVRRADHFQ